MSISQPAQTVLFFSRGRGRGHAVPDHFIAGKLRQNNPNLEIKFVSYAIGAATLRQLGEEVIDFDLPEDNPFFVTMAKAYRLIIEKSPCVVLCHEEFCVPIAARLAGVPTVFLIDWFMDSNARQMKSLEFAEHIVFLDQPGIFDEPACVYGRTHYCGPFVRPLQYGARDKSRAREELGLPADAFILLGLPGNYLDSGTPIFQTVVAALELLNRRDKKLYFVAGPIMRICYHWPGVTLRWT